MASPSQLDDAGDAVRQTIRTFHGSPSPNHHDRFDARYIGDGEGNAAYAYGHYSAQDQSIADWYRRELSRKKLISDWRQELTDDAEASEVMDVVGSGYFDHRQERLLRALDADDWLGFDYPSQAANAALSKDIGNWDPSPELIKAKDNLGTGYVLDINLPEKSLLDWDAPINQQGHIAKAFENIVHGGTNPKFLHPTSAQARGRSGVLTALDVGKPGSEAYRSLGEFLLDPEGIFAGGRKMARAASASQALADHGVPGVRYLDANSRRAGEGSRNIVVFPKAEDAIRILAKYGWMAPVMAAGVENAKPATAR